MNAFEYARAVRRQEQPSPQLASHRPPLRAPAAAAGRRPHRLQLPRAPRWGARPPPPSSSCCPLSSSARLGPSAPTANTAGPQRHSSAPVNPPPTQRLCSCTRKGGAGRTFLPGFGLLRRFLVGSKPLSVGSRSRGFAEVAALLPWLRSSTTANTASTVSLAAAPIHSLERFE